MNARRTNSPPVLKQASVLKQAPVLKQASGLKQVEEKFNLTNEIAINEIGGSIEPTLTASESIAVEILEERARQDEKWNEQNHPDGTGYPYYREQANYQKGYNDQAVAGGHLTWRDILLEEVYEALAEPVSSAALREELIQVAAVAAGWIESIDRAVVIIEENAASFAVALELQEAEEETSAAEG